MPKKQIVHPQELGALAKRYRLLSGKTKIEAAAELGVNRTSIQLAEENPEQRLPGLRIRMIERFSRYRMVGPVYVMELK